MKERKAIRKGLALALVFVLVAAMFVIILPMNVSAGWTGNVTIKSDGSVDPSTAPISVSGKIYTLTDDIYGTITIEKDGITLDGKGYTVEGTGSGFGISVDGYPSGFYGLKLKNLHVKKFSVGIYFYYVDKSKITQNTFSECNYGISFNNNCDNNKVSENKMMKNRISIGSYRSTNNMFSENEITGGWTGSNTLDVGIYVHLDSDNNKIKGNLISEISRYGIGISYSDGNIIKENMIKKIGEDGLYLSNAENNEIKDNIISYNSRDGIRIYRSDDNTIAENTIQNNDGYGIDLYISDWNTLIGNSMNYNGYDGLGTYLADFNIIKENTCSYNDWDGIYLSSSSNNEVQQNTISGNYWGLSMDTNSDNIIIENDVSDNEYGFWMEDAIDNTLYHNNIIDNTYAFDTTAWWSPSTSEADNTWDNGKGEGNYWSDYTGSDTNNDGIGDTDLPHNGVDYYPLMEEYDD